MDPVSITSSVFATTRICLGAAKRLYDLVDRYRHASRTIAAIYSESMVIGASLRQIQNILSQNKQEYIQHFQEQPDLTDVFEAALLGCTLVYSCLDDEVQHLKKETNDTAEVNRLARARFLWKEETMKELLQSIRAQSAAITLLLQCLQFETVTSMQKTLESVRQMVANINDRIVNSAESKPGVTEALLQNKFASGLVAYHTAWPGASNDDASTLGLAPSTIYQASRRSYISSTSDFSFETPEHHNSTRPTSLTADLFRRLSQRLPGPIQTDEAPPVPTLLPHIASSSERQLSTSTSSAETPDEEQGNHFEEQATDEGYESESDASGVAPVIAAMLPPASSALAQSDPAYLPDPKLPESGSKRYLENTAPGKKYSGLPSDLKSSVAEDAFLQKSSTTGTLIEQAVNDLMKRLSLAPGAPVAILNAQYQGQQPRLITASPTESLSSQSLLSLLGTEPPSTSTPASGSDAGDRVTPAPSHVSPDPFSFQQPAAGKAQDLSGWASPSPREIDEAINRVLRPNSRAHLRVPSTSSITRPLPRPNIPLTLAVLDSLCASRAAPDD